MTLLKEKLSHYWECTECKSFCGWLTHATPVTIIRVAFCRTCDKTTEQDTQMVDLDV